MEPITLCGLVIVIFGFWIECEPVVAMIVKKTGKWRKLCENAARSTNQKTVYVRRMPICVAKGL